MVVESEVKKVISDNMLGFDMCSPLTDVLSLYGMYDVCSPSKQFEPVLLGLQPNMEAAFSDDFVSVSVIVKYRPVNVYSLLFSIIPC